MWKSLLQIWADNQVVASIIQMKLREAQQMEILSQTSQRKIFQQKVLDFNLS